MFKPWLSIWSTTAAQISLEMTILLLFSPPPPLSSPCPSYPLPPPCPPPPPHCPPTPPLPCPRPSCPPLPPPLTLTPLLLWLLISSKFSIVYQTKQRLKALLCCSPHCKLLNRPECLEIWLFVCCRLMLWDFTWEVCATTEHCVLCFDNKVMCNWHQSVNKENQSLMQIRQCEVVPNWVERLVHEVKVVQIVPNFRFLCVNNCEKL